jgi:serine/threonine protein kinase
MAICVSGMLVSPTRETIAPRADAQQSLAVETTVMITEPEAPARKHFSHAATIVSGLVGVELPLELRYIGGVKVKCLLGTGGMGKVFLGRHDTLDIPVAVKVIKRERGDAQRFLQEVRASAKIQHPNVVRVYHAGAEEGQLFLVMEVIGGGDVSDLIKRDGCVPWRRAVDLLRQAAEGLAAIHDCGIVHRDIKPANCMLDEHGVLKIADLGLAKQLDDDIGITHCGSIMGTPAYMSPEQIKDIRSVTPAADVYSLGVSFYQMLVGRLPFEGETTTQVILAHLNDPVPRLEQVLPQEVPQQVIDLLRRMLAKDAADRPADGRAVAADLARIARQAKTNTRHRGPPNLSPNRRWPVAFALGGVVAIGALFALANGLQEQPHERSPGPPAAAEALTVDLPSPPPNEAAELAQSVAGGPAMVAAVAAAPVVIDRWQSPERAVFLLPGDIPVAQSVVLESALLQAPQRVVERRDVELFLAEQSLSGDGRMSAATAVRIGHGIGAHIGVTARSSGEQIELRAFAVETTELAGVRMVAPEALASAATDLVRATVETLPLRGYLRPLPDGGHEISLGGRHGLIAGATLVVRPELEGEPGAPAAVGTVEELGAVRSRISLEGALDGHAGAWLVEVRRD